MNKIKLLVLILFAFFNFKVHAADIVVSCGNAGCNFESNTSVLFDYSRIYPNWSDTQTLKVTNNYNEDRNFLIEITNTSHSNTQPNIFDVINLTIKNSNDKTIYGPVSISKLKDDDIVSLNRINSKDTEEYKIKVEMENVGNEYQNIEGSFDLKLGFEVVSEQAENNINVENILTTFNAIAQGSNITPTVSPISKSSGDVKGISEECTDNLFWLFVLILQFIIAVVCYVFKTKLKKISYVIYLLINLLIMCYLYNFFCQKGYLFLSIVVFIIFIIPLFYRQKTDKH